MHEDWRIERDHFPSAGRVFCIASAGCTAFALSSLGYEVTAVDINPEQVRHVERRLAAIGAEVEERSGLVERTWERARRFQPWLGQGRASVRRFLELDDPAVQEDVWRTRLETRRFRTVVGLALHPLVLRTLYAEPFLEAIPTPFAPVLLKRLRRGFAHHANATNPYAWQLLLGRDPAGYRAPRPRPERLRVVCADAIEYLEAESRGSFDAFTLSNIVDGPEAAYRERLRKAVRRAARPGAVVVVRSFREPEDEAADTLAARDRAFLWGSIRVEML